MYEKIIWGTKTLKIRRLNVRDNILTLENISHNIRNNARDGEWKKNDLSIN